MYDLLLSPITINGLEIKNRVVYPSLGLLYSYDGKLNDRYYNYFREKARGGTGWVTFGPVGIDEIGSGIILPNIMRDEDLPAFEKMAQVIKQEGSRAWIQLFHAGGYAHPMLIDNQQPWAPSAIFSKYSKTTPREMTLEDIEQVQQAFIEGAARAQTVGFDGVELIASGGYLITQFLSPLKNKRTDAYGGSFENRIRFPREVIEKTRARLGADYPLTIRMAGNDFVPGSNTDTETAAIARIYEAAGVDAISVTGGWHETRVPQLPASLPRTGFAFLSANIKKEVSIPVIASNRIPTPDDAEKLLREGSADMVSIGRGLIADPHWVNKAAAGKADEIRPCVACLQGCMDNVMSGKPVTCVANPLAGYEGVRKVEKADHARNIMIIGAGLAGLEAAVVCAQAGHHVRLYEKGAEIGGQIHVAGAPPHKGELKEFLRYYRLQLKKYNIPVFLNTAADIELIKHNKPDFIVIAAGAGPLIPPIPGIDDPRVTSAWDLLRNNTRLGKAVAVIGGGSVGLEAALWVASQGALTPEVLYFLFANEAIEPERLRELMFQGTSKVTVFEMLPKAGKDLGKSTKWVLMNELARFGVIIHTDTQVQRIQDGGIHYVKEGVAGRQGFDNIIVAAGSKPDQALTQHIEGLGIPYAAIGDCVKPGKMNDAIHGGFLVVQNIG